MSSADAAARVLAGLDAIGPWQEALYRTLHQHPELPNRDVAAAFAEHFGPKGKSDEEPGTVS